MFPSGNIKSQHLMRAKAFVMNVFLLHAQIHQLFRGKLHEANRAAEIELHCRIAERTFQFAQIHQTFAIKLTFSAIGFARLTIRCAR